MSWWRANAGVFENLESVFPFLVLEKIPDACDAAPKPLLMGGQAYQKTVLGFDDAKSLADQLGRQPEALRRRACEERIAIANYWAPEIALKEITWVIDGTPQLLRYNSTVLPVRNTKGAQFLLTISEQVVIH